MCKISKNNCGNGEKSNKIKTKFACILEVNESTRLRMFVWENHCRIIMKTILQEEEDNSLQHYNLVHKFIPLPQGTKIPGAKAAVEKMKHGEKSGMAADKSQKQERCDQ